MCKQSTKRSHWYTNTIFFLFCKILLQCKGMSGGSYRGLMFLSEWSLSMAWLKIEPVTSRAQSGCSTLLNVQAESVSDYRFIFCSVLFYMLFWLRHLQENTPRHSSVTKRMWKMKMKKWKNNNNNQNKTKKNKKKLHKAISCMKFFSFEACFVFTHVHENVCKTSEIFETGNWLMCNYNCICIYTYKIHIWWNCLLLARG